MPSESEKIYDLKLWRLLGTGKTKQLRTAYEHLLMEKEYGKRKRNHYPDRRNTLRD